MRIIYKNPDNSISIIVPADCGLPIDTIAKKDVPTGVPYWIVEDSEIPEDRSFRNAWTFETDREADGVGD